MIKIMLIRFARGRALRPRAIVSASRQLASSSVCVQAEATRDVPTIIHPDDSIEVAIKVGCARLQRNLPPEVEDRLISSLTSNWYTSAKDIASMSEEESISVGLPLRLRSTISSALSDLDQRVETMQLTTGHRVGEGGRTEGGKETATLQHAMDPEQETHAVSDTKSIDQISIRERVCPPLNRFGHKAADTPNVVSRGEITKYALSQSELTPELKTSFDALMSYGTERFYGAQVEPIKKVTAEKYADHLRAMLGYLHRYHGVPLESLTFSHLVPSVERDGVIPAFEYIQWLLKERKIAARTELLVLRSILYAAKFIYHDQSHVVSGSGERPYNDLGVVKELRSLINTRRKSSKVAPRVADEKAKWVDWDEYILLCQELRRECAAIKPDGKLRSDKEIAWSIQRYLIFSILSCCPDRQRTLRELQLGRTLFKEGDEYIIRHKPEDYKTGKAYGERAPMVLSEFIYPELEAWITEWREKLNPQHKFLFTQANGYPLTEKSLYKLFRTTAYRITGKRLTPHMVRDAVVTHLRGTNASEKELEALAMYMGHSVAMQRETYDRRTKEEKVEPAISLLRNLARS